MRACVFARSPVGRVEMRVGGASILPVQSAGEGVWHVEWDMGQVGNGWHALEVMAQGPAGGPGRATIDVPAADARR